MPQAITLRKKVTVPDLLALKGKRKIINGSVMDVSMAAIIDASNIDMCGCGASVAAMVIQGYTNPIPATMDQVLLYLRPIAMALKRAMLLATLPYGTVQVSNQEAVRGAIQYMQAGLGSVKVEGTGRIVERIHAIVSAGIPCMGHVGMAPQQIHTTGGYRAVGRTAAEAVQVYKDATMLQDAGCWMIELECVPWRVAEVITRRLGILTMGTGSGLGCDGQGLMTQDLWNLPQPVKPRLSKQYDDLYGMSLEALKRFKQEVKARAFPPDRAVAQIPDDEFNRFVDLID
jgi:3-methyl-2-oxobutanoate hydroxymethyltransferase